MNVFARPCSPNAWVGKHGGLAASPSGGLLVVLDLGDDPVRNPDRRRVGLAVDVDVLDILVAGPYCPGLGQMMLAFREDDDGDRHARQFGRALDLDYQPIVVEINISTRNASARGEVDSIANDFVPTYSIIHLSQEGLVEEKSLERLKAK